MAFTFRKMLSNIGYFKKTDNNDSDTEIIPTDSGSKRRRNSSFSNSPAFNDSISSFQIGQFDIGGRKYNSVKKSTDSNVKYFRAKQDSDHQSKDGVLKTSTKKMCHHRTKKLKIDIDKAITTQDNASTTIDLSGYTPKHISLGIRSKDIWKSDSFSATKTDTLEAITRMQLLDAMRESPNLHKYESETTDTDDDLNSDIGETTDTQSDCRRTVKMCKKVYPAKSNEPSCSFKTTTSKPKTESSQVSPKGAHDLDVENNEELRVSMLLGYQTKLDKIERSLKSLLCEYQFQIEASHIFKSRTCIRALPGSDVTNLPKVLGDITNLNSAEGKLRFGGKDVWNIHIEKEDDLAKQKLKEQLISMKATIDTFVNSYLTKPDEEIKNETTNQMRSLQDVMNVFDANSSFIESIWNNGTSKKTSTQNNLKNVSFKSQHEGPSTSMQKNSKRCEKKMKINAKKKAKRVNEFPDLTDIFINLYKIEQDLPENDGRKTSINLDNISSIVRERTCNVDSNVVYSSSPIEKSTQVNEETCKKCKITAATRSDSTDSGLHNKDSASDNRSTYTTSSMNDFSISKSAITAFSESMDNAISLASFNESSDYNSLVPTSAIERLKFYTQIHQIFWETSDKECSDLSSDSISSPQVRRIKSSVSYVCSQCPDSIFKNEQSLLKHIVSDKHCEKLHFFYKVRYMKHCMKNALEMTPSTILNPMPLYRDLNKIVCFGDGKYACTLCFQSLIVGESQLINHCWSAEHKQRREKIKELCES